MPEIYYEVPPFDVAPPIDVIGRSARGAPTKFLSLAALVAGLLAYSATPPPDEWQRWLNKAVRHWLWYEMHRRRRRHYPNAYTDNDHAPIH